MIVWRPGAVARSRKTTRVSAPLGRSARLQSICCVPVHPENDGAPASASPAGSARSTCAPSAAAVPVFLTRAQTSRSALVCAAVVLGASVTARFGMPPAGPGGGEGGGGDGGGGGAGAVVVVAVVVVGGAAGTSR